MKKYICFLLLNMAVVLGAAAQDMASVFVAMPDENVPQLENEWRKDLIDLYHAGKEAKLKNTMDGYSVLKKLTDDYLLLESTGRSSIEMKLLPLVNNTKVICVVNTVKGPAPDSRVSFFTTEWEPLDSADLFIPVASEWFLKEDADKNSNAYREATSLLDINLVKYTLSPDDQTLTATFTTPLYLGKEEREKVIPFIKETPKVYTWKKFRFE